MAIEVKAAGRWQERGLAGLRAFLDKTSGCQAALLAYGGTETVQLAERLWAVPLSTVVS
jgi:hypothetical protein